MRIDGKPYVPLQIGANGLRFVSIHKGKQNTFVVTYARGTGDVIIPLPDGSTGSVTVARGFEYHATTAAFRIADNESRCSVTLRRWINLAEEGWQSTDEHVHYERTDRQHDRDWLTMLEADGLSHAHFLVLKGGNVPGIWAQQYAYGPDGEARSGSRFIRSGEEYRDSAQGHINLLGIENIIEPISTGGVGRSTRFNYPPLVDVFREAHRLGGVGGPAHGGALAKSSTALLDSILGEVDFFEIANSHLVKTDVWYLLLNGGFIIPPVAGTDLPNFGFRDDWQPLFGEVRTYVRVGDQNGFPAWVAALRRGEVFVTSGPLINFRVNGQPVGSVVKLPAGGGEVDVTAELSSPRELKSLEVFSMGKPIDAEAVESSRQDVTTLTIRKRISVTQSCWIAARGEGGRKAAIEKGLGIEQAEFAHSGIIQVIVDDAPIRSESAITELGRQLVKQQQYYRTEGRFETPEHRTRFTKLFERAISRLNP